jgi:hypothetical protein
MKSLFFLDVTQRLLIIICLSYGTKYRSYHQGSRSSSRILVELLWLVDLFGKSGSSLKRTLPIPSHCHSTNLPHSPYHKWNIYRAMHGTRFSIPHWHNVRVLCHKKNPLKNSFHPAVIFRVWTPKIFFQRCKEIVSSTPFHLLLLS